MSKSDLVVMESGKFLSTINNSAQSKVAQFEGMVRKLGQKSGSKWRLAALNNTQLVIEDITTNTYYVGKHTKVKGGRITISNITPIKIVEEKKQPVFEQNCYALVKAIEENDNRGMRTAFNNLAFQRFSPKTVPSDGLVKTRDGVVRKINISESKLTDKQKSKLIAAIVENVTGHVKLSDGRVVSAVFGDNKKKYLPISEWTCRRVVGNKMRETAKNAYLSKGFQSRIYKIAKLINNDSIAEAVKCIKPFLAEAQEFALLSRSEIKTLIENTLSASAVLNQKLCDNTTALFYRTNLLVNKKDIIENWKATAKKAGHPTLLENVNVLEKSDNFEATYDKFLNMAFNEAISPRDEEINAYRTALDLLRQSPKIQEDVELKTKVDELIGRLTGQEVDDATVHLVRETLAAARKEVDSLNKLSDFDQMPGDNDSAGLDDAVGDALADPVEQPATGNGQPTIVINAPLISTGAYNGPQSDADDGLADLGGEDFSDEDELGLGDEDELGLGGEDELGLGGDGGGGEDELGLGGGDDLGLDLNSRRKPGNKLTESQKVAKLALGKKITEDDDWFKDNIANNDEDSSEEDAEDAADSESESFEFDENSDPYSFEESVEFDSGMGVDYGKKILEDREISNVISTMLNIVEERSLTPEQVSEELDGIALEAIRENGVRIPDNRISEEVHSLVEMFKKKCVSEDQRKWATLRRRRGLRKSNLARDEHEDGNKGGGSGGGEGSTGFSGSAPTNDSAGFDGAMPGNEKDGFKGTVAEGRMNSSIRWVAHDKDKSGIAGDIDGVGFTLDYLDPPVIFSEDGSVEVPVPRNLVESAMAAANLTQGDSRPFTRWLQSNVEQLRPINESEDNELNEAIATITANADGSIEVSVDGDVEVMDEMDPDEMGGIGGMEVDVIDMQPVVELGDEDTEPEMDSSSTEEMPDFEDGDESGDFTPDPDEDLDEGQEESPVTEDKDVTDPTKSDYDTTGQDHREMPKEAGKAQKPHDGKKIEGFDKKAKMDTSADPKTKLEPVKPGANRPTHS